MLSLSFIYMIQILGDIVIEFLLDLPSYLPDFFHNCIFHITPRFPPL